MSDLSEKEWQRIRQHFGDLAYEHAEMHKMMLELLSTDDLDKALETATDELPQELRAQRVRSLC